MNIFTREMMVIDWVKKNGYSEICINIFHTCFPTIRRIPSPPTTDRRPLHGVQSPSSSPSNHTINSPHLHRRRPYTHHHNFTGSHLRRCSKWTQQHTPSQLLRISWRTRSMWTDLWILALHQHSTRKPIPDSSIRLSHVSRRYLSLFR